MMKFVPYLIVVIVFLRNACALGPVTLVVPIVVATFAGYWYQGYESCNDKWISFNKKDLYYELNRRMYGQHLVSDIIYNAIKGHMKNKSPKKALALSFNGMTGVGKNYASRIIAENIYRKGFESKFVKMIIGSHDFKHRYELARDKLKLKKWITEQVSKCPRSLFIIDEVEKMNPELVDVLKPYLSHYTQVDGVDYRKSIFIFMGNTGADLINKEVVKQRQEKKRREDITIKQMDRILSKEALKKAGGFLHSTLLEHQLIDYFIPFLPLEKQHVKKCIEDDLEDKKYEASDINIQKIVDELEYFPDDSHGFSESGCKKVSSKVDRHFGQI